MLDLNDANEQRQDGIIPDGTFAKVILQIQEGGVDGDDPIDKGILTQSKSSDAQMLNCEFTVLYGPHAKRKIWQYMTVKSSKSNKAWDITKDTIRAIVDSALALDPKDKSEATRYKRHLPGFAVLNNLEFAVKIGVEFGTDGYQDKNKIARIVVLSDPEYAAVMRGEEVPAKPTSRAPRAASNGHAAPVQQQMGWGQASPAPTGGAGTAHAATWGAANTGTATLPAPNAAPNTGPSWLRETKLDDEIPF